MPVLLNPRRFATGLVGGPVMTLTVPAGKVASTLTSFVTRVDLADLPTGWWATTSTDLGNVRVKQSGTVIPFDVVWYDRTNRKGTLYFKATLTTSANVFTVECVAGATGLAATDPNGRNAVWSDYDAVVIGNEGINRVDGTALGTYGSVPTMGPIDKSPQIPAHQGVAVDTSGNFYGVDTDAIRKYNSSWTLQTTRTNAAAHVLSTLGLTVNHLNDPFWMNGYLYTPFDYRPSGTVTNYYIIKWDPSTLTALASWDLTSYPSYPWMCYNPADGYVYGIDSGPGDELRKFDTSFVQQSVVTLPTSLSNPAGIACCNNKLYVTNDADDSLYEIPLNGSSVTKVYDFNAYQFTTLEGIASDGTFVYVDGDETAGATIYKMAFNGGAYGPHFDRRGSLKASVPKRSSYTLSATGRSSFPAQGLAGTSNEQYLGYGPDSTDNTTRSNLGQTGSAGSFQLGTYNSTDNNLVDTSVPTVAAFTDYRLAATIDGTTVRKLYRDGTLRATDNTISLRPTGTTEVLFIGGALQNTSLAMLGQVRRAYLRNGILGADWLSAEYASWETPSTFYAIT